MKFKKLEKLIVRLVATVLVTIQISWYLSLWLALLWDISIAKRTDFIALYISGKLAKLYGWTKIYDLDLQYFEHQSILGFNFDIVFFLPNNHPPLLLPILRLIYSENFLQSYLLWFLFLLFLIAGAVFLLLKLFKKHGFSAKNRLFFIISISLFYPLFISLLKGQDSALLFLGMAILYYGIDQQKDGLAGFGLALITIRPQLAIILGLPFVLKRQRVFGYFLVFGGFLVLYCFLMVGLPGFQDLLQLLINSAQSIHNSSQASMYNLLGFLLRTFPKLRNETAQIISWIVYGVSILSLCFFWYSRRSIGIQELSVAVLVSILASPHLHFHDMVIILIPLLTIGLVAVEKLNLPQSAIPFSILIVSSILLFSELSNALRVTIPYLLWIILSLGVLQISRLSILRGPLREKK